MPPETKWETDADNIDPGLAEEILFKNAIVEEFIQSSNKYFVVAGKGIGKTLLLKFKRHLLETSQRDGRIFVPTDRPFLDHVSTVGYPSKKHLDYLRNWHNARGLWELAISLSGISYYHATTHARPSAYWIEAENKSPELKNLALTESPWKPSEVFYELLHLPISTLLDLVDTQHIRVARALGSVQSGLYIFIDQLDQALLHYDDRALWVGVQVGLLEAAWAVMRTNHHVKVYTSMRQEAYANYQSPNKNAISGQISFIKYTFNDLARLLDRLVAVYEGKASYEDFLGFSTVENSHTGDTEEVFSYLYRHTIGRPRDLVSICSKIAPANHSGAFTATDFKEIVNEVSSADVVWNIFSEVSPLLRALSKETEREKFLSLLPANVLLMKEMKDVCRTFNGFVECPAEDCKRCQSQHPFCDLYNIGLLGVVAANEVTGKRSQHFLEPYRLEEYSLGVLPSTSSFYLVHPSLNEGIRHVRSRLQGREYELMRVTVGQGRDWGDRQEVLCALPAVIASCPEPTIRKMLSDLMDSTLSASSDKPTTSLSEAFIDQVWRINELVVSQLPHAVWAGLWSFIVELCRKSWQE